MPTFVVRDWVDVHHVQRHTLAFAAEVGFARRECAELAIVASELTSNILKYGVHGRVALDPYQDERGSGLLIVASDSGPPFHDLELAKRDGHDDRGPIDPLQMLKRKGIGGGLGAVLRLTHSFHVEQDAHGKKVHVVRYLNQRLPVGR